MAGLVCFFSAKAFLISAIIIVKIVCLGFLVSRANGVALVVYSYIGSSLASGLVLGIESVLDSGLGSLSIFFIIKY